MKMVNSSLLTMTVIMRLCLNRSKTRNSLLKYRSKWIRNHAVSRKLKPKRITSLIVISNPH